MIIDGHGEGVMDGGAPPNEDEKLADTRREKNSEGWPLGAKHPGEKNFWPPGEAIFFAFFSKITPRCSSKTRRRKKFFTLRWRRRRKNFSVAEGGQKIFFEPPPGVHPLLVPKPVPIYDYNAT